MRLWLCLSLLLGGCSLDLHPTIRLSLDKKGKPPSSRNPDLASLKFAVSFSGGGLADTYGGSSLRGREASCVKLSGYVSKLFTLTELEEGVALPIPSGSYTAHIVGISGVAGATTVPEALASGSPEIYPVASGTISVAEGKSSLREDYTATVPADLFGSCPDMSQGGNTLTLVYAYQSFSGTLGGTTILFDPNEGKLPPRNPDGSDATLITPANFFSLYQYFPPSAAYNYFPRLDLQFAASKGLLLQYRGLRVVAGVSPFTSTGGGSCATPIPAAIGAFTMAGFLGSGPLPGWDLGTLSPPDNERTLVLQPTVMSDLFTPLSARSAGGVLISIRGESRSTFGGPCGGLRLNSVTATLLP